MTNNRTYFSATNRQRFSERDVDRVQVLYRLNYAPVLPADRDAVIVDLGCSEGIALEWLADLGYKNLLAVDSDQVAVSIARERLERYIDTENICTGDILHYIQGLPSNSAQIILMNDVIEHLDSDYLELLIPDILRVLKSGGSFIAKTGNMENPFNLALFARDFTHKIFFTTNSLKQLMIMSGFLPNMIDVQPVKFPVTAKNWPVHVSSAVVGRIIKIVARSMFIRIHHTHPLIFCKADKH